MLYGRMIDIAIAKIGYWIKVNLTLDGIFYNCYFFWKEEEKTWVFFIIGLKIKTNWTPTALCRATYTLLNSVKSQS